MKDSILNKLHTLLDRHEEVAGLLADPDIINNQNQFRELSQEYAQLEPVVNCFQEYNGARDDLTAAEEMMKDDDADVREMALEEKKEANRQKAIKHELEWVRSNPKGRQAKSKARITAFESLVADAAKAKRDANEIRIPPGPRLGTQVFEVEGVTKAYGDKLLFDDDPRNNRRNVNNYFCSGFANHDQSLTGASGRT